MRSILSRPIRSDESHCICWRILQLSVGIFKCRYFSSVSIFKRRYIFLKCRYFLSAGIWQVPVFFKCLYFSIFGISCRYFSNIDIFGVLVFFECRYIFQMSVFHEYRYFRCRYFSIVGILKTIQERSFRAFDHGTRRLGSISIRRSVLSTHQCNYTITEKYQLYVYSLSNKLKAQLAFSVPMKK